MKNRIKNKKMGLKVTKLKSTPTKDKKTAKTDETWVYSTAEICDFFEISAETLNNWYKKGAPKKGYGKWNLKELIKWKYTQTDSPETRKIKAEADLKEAKAEQELIKLEKERGKYIPVSQVKEDLIQLFGYLKKEITSLGHEVATEINSYDAEIAISAKEVIDKKVNYVLELLSKGEGRIGSKKKK